MTLDFETQLENRFLSKVGDPSGALIGSSVQLESGC